MTTRLTIGAREQSTYLKSIQEEPHGKMSNPPRSSEFRGNYGLWGCIGWPPDLQSGIQTGALPVRSTFIIGSMMLISKTRYLYLGEINMSYAKIDNLCKYCEKSFEDLDSKVFANHVRWCDKNTSNGDKGRSNMSSKILESFENKIGKIVEFDVTCKKCNKEFKVKERQKQFPKKEHYFCSRICANSRGKRTEEFKQKVRDKMKQSGHLKHEFITVDNNRVTNKVCDFCGNDFKAKNAKIKYCSKICRSNNKRKTFEQSKSGKSLYRYQTKFNFSLSDFPEEFDFELIEKFGWYSAKNRGNNLNGISRDHKISVLYGYENNIDPKIISHPANCELIRHNDNVSKGKKNSITLEELQERIKVWNFKYTS